MISENLKHYKKHLRKLVKFANALGIKVEFKHEVSDGVFIPWKRKIRIDDSMTETETVATLLHEIGHMLDDLTDLYSSPSKIAASYHAVYYSKPTRVQKAAVLACETRAWNIGRLVAKQLKIRLGAWYLHYANLSLQTYQETKCR